MSYLSREIKCDYPGCKNTVTVTGSHGIPGDYGWEEYFPGGTRAPAHYCEEHRETFEQWLKSVAGIVHVVKGSRVDHVKHLDKIYKDSKNLLGY